MKTPTGFRSFVKVKRSSMAPPQYSGFVASSALPLLLLLCVEPTNARRGLLPYGSFTKILARTGTHVTTAPLRRFFINAKTFSNDCYEGRRDELPRTSTAASVVVNDDSIISSMPTMKRGMEIQVGETAVTIPFSKTAGMRIVAKLEEVYRLFEDLEIERLEDSDSGFTVESFIPIMAIREEVVKRQNGNKSYICTRDSGKYGTVELEITCNPNQKSSPVNAKAMVNVRYGGMVLSGETSLENIRADISAYTNDAVF